jgi:hypothetical protein
MTEADNQAPDIFGRSLELVEGDLRFAGGDLAGVAGRDNLAQGLRVAIETPFGTDIFNVNYGFDFLRAIGQAGGRLVKEHVRLNLIKSLSRDDRVREVRDVIFDDDPRFFEHNPQADPEEVAALRRATRRWQALVLLDAGTGGEVAVQLEGTGI